MYLIYVKSKFDNYLMYLIYVLFFSQCVRSIQYEKKEKKKRKRKEGNMSNTNIPFRQSSEQIGNYKAIIQKVHLNRYTWI